MSQSGVPMSAGGGVPPSQRASVRAASAARITASSLVGGEGDELALAENLDRRLGGLAHGALVERGEMRAAPGLAQHAGVQHVLRRDVVDEARARDLGRQVEPRQVLADDLVGRRPLDRRGAAGAAVERDLAGHRPVVAAGVLAGAQELAVLDRKLARPGSRSASAARSRNSERTSAQTSRIEAPPTAIE